MKLHPIEYVFWLLGLALFALAGGCLGAVLEWAVRWAL